MEKTLNKKRKNLWLEVTIVSAILLLLLGVGPLGWGIAWPLEFWWKQLLFAMILAIAYFINAFYFVPSFLLKNKVAQYILVLIVSVIVILALALLIEHALQLPRLIHEIIRPDKPYTPKGWFRFDFPGLLITLLTFGISTSSVLLRKGQQDSLLRKELEKQQVSTELSFLKAQINPHFFFNTLNNIYALTTLDVELAQKAIHMLSAMMRYVLYDARKEYVLVSQEIRFIENYIELMKLRLPSKAKVTFERTDNFQQELIAPMLLLPYVENAFKHGISAQNPSEIKINISHGGNQLKMHIENTIFQTNALNLEGSGIGLVNTQRRLDLLYPGKHEVKNQKHADRYVIDFSLALTSGEQNSGE